MMKGTTVFGKLFKKATSAAKNVEVGVETEIPVDGAELGDTEVSVEVGVSSATLGKAARGLGGAAKRLADTGKKDGEPTAQA